MRLSLRAPFFKACRRAEKAPQQFHYTPRAQKKPWAAQKFAFRSQKFFPAFTARPSCGVLRENFHFPQSEADGSEKIPSVPAVALNLPHPARICYN